MPGQRHPQTLVSFLHTFPWIHIGLGAIGHVGFVIGSIMFLLGISAGVFFVIGSIGMLIGSTGNLFVQIEDRRLRNQGFNPYNMPSLRKSERAAQQAAESAEQAASEAKDEASEQAEPGRSAS